MAVKKTLENLQEKMIRFIPDTVSGPQSHRTSFSISPLLFIRPRSHHSVPLSLLNSLADSLTHSCCLELTDTTLAFEDANAELLDVVDIADVDAKQLVGDGLVEISLVIFGRDIEPEFI